MPLTRQPQPGKPAKAAKPAANRATPASGSRAQAQLDSPEQIAQLQRQYGNRAVQRLIQRAQPTHPAQPLAAATPARVQRAAAPAAGDPQDQTLGQRAGDGFEAGAAFEARLSAARGSGTALPASTRGFMEQRLGADFSGVRVHTDGQSHQLNQAIQAKAFTTGQDVFFREGEYAPGSREGQTLLAHELAHVVQQQGGAVQRSTARVQRQFKFVKDGSGEYEAEERVSFDQLLAHNQIDPLAFTAADFAQLQAAYARLAPLVAKVGKTTAQKKREAKQALQDAYAKLGDDIELKMLAEGKPNWDAAVELVVRQYNDLPKAEQIPTEKHYAKISEPVWPTVGGRGAMPDSFWRSVKKNIKSAFVGGAAAGAAAFSPECDAVYGDMGTQFTAWDGSLTNRGAWWGSAAPGSTAGAKDVPSTVILELQKKVVGSGWKFSNSFSGGISFHKTRGATDFIYHMQAI